MVRFIPNRSLKPAQEIVSLDRQTAAAAHRFLASIPGYQMTPLYRLSDLADKLGVAELWVKDESKRLGLNAFKAVGAVYAVGKTLAQKLQLADEELNFTKLTSMAHKLPPITFTTATDGNHGKAVAWAARELGHKAVIYLPQGASIHRVEAIRQLCAEAYVTDLNYDDAVRLAAASAAQYGWVLVQDTAWPGYTEIPEWIMQGYTIIAHECLEQMPQAPTHVLLQAGVGSFAGATLAYLVNMLGADYPVTAIVEPHNAACILASAQQNDGKPHNVEGSLETIMAGLSCGEPNPAAWDILRDYAHVFCSCGDETAKAGMRLLAYPIGGDALIVAGESGAVGLGLVAEIMGNIGLLSLREALGLNDRSRVLVVNTEGDTDPENYMRIINGAGI